MTDLQEGVLVRQLSTLERSMIVAHRHSGIKVTVDAVHIRSVRPIDDSNMLTALSVLQRKFQNLRLVIQIHTMSMNFLETPSAKIDYQRIEHKPWQTAHQELVNKKFDVEAGPLWCCRLVDVDKLSSCARIGAMSSMNEPYVLMFAHLHGLTDGISNMKMCGEFIKILNCVLEGEVVDESYIPLHPSLDELLPPEAFKSTLNDLSFSGKLLYKFAFPSANRVTKKFGSHKDVTACTKVIYRELCEVETLKFIQKCKQSGSTFHGAFTLIAGMALCDLLQEKISHGNDITLNIGHAVNLRKYITSDTSDAYGIYITYMLHNITVKHDVRKKFWEYAQQYTRDLHGDLKKGNALQANRLVRFLAWMTKLFFDRQKLTNNCEYEFGTTNVGNVDQFLDVGGKHVEPVAVFRSTGFHYMSITFLHSIQTFRNRLNYNLDYFPNYVSEKLAKEYADRIMRLITEVSDY